MSDDSLVEVFVAVHPSDVDRLKAAADELNRFWKPALPIDRDIAQVRAEIDAQIELAMSVKRVPRGYWPKRREAESRLKELRRARWAELERIGFGWKGRA